MRVENQARNLEIGVIYQPRVFFGSFVISTMTALSFGALMASADINIDKFKSLTSLSPIELHPTFLDGMIIGSFVSLVNGIINGRNELGAGRALGALSVFATVILVRQYFAGSV